MVVSLGDGTMVLRLSYNRATGTKRLQTVISDGANTTTLSINVDDSLAGMWHDLDVVYSGTDSRPTSADPSACG